MSKKALNIILVILCLMPAIIAVIVHTYVVNTLAIDGKKLQDIDDNIAYLERENSVLNLEKSKLGTTSLISEKAQKLGMKNVTVSFVSEDSFALAKE